jgi:hypothetical protein
MPRGGEGTTVERSFTVLDAHHPYEYGTDNELLEHQYVVGSSDGAAIAHVGITPYARQKGDEAYSGIRVSGVRAGDTASIGTALETYVTPPLLTEDERRQAALNVSQLAVGLAMTDVRQ